MVGVLNMTRLSSSLPSMRVLATLFVIYFAAFVSVELILFKVQTGLPLAVLIERVGLPRMLGGLALMSVLASALSVLTPVLFGRRRRSEGA
jgi:hypothetical protein